VQEAVFFAVADLLNLEVDLLFFDTTSTYFERDTEEAPSEDRPDGGLRRYGHSKDSRPDLPQIVIGLAVTREGIPVRCWVWPGNTADVTVLPEVKDDLRGWRLGRVVTVVDRGFSSRSNLDYLRRAGGHWIAGGTDARRQPPSPGGAVPPGPLPAGPGQSAGQGSRARQRVRSALDRLPQPGRSRAGQAPPRPGPGALGRELERIKTARARDAQRRKAGTKTPADDVHVRAECALRDHPTLGRWLRQLPSGRLVLDRKKIAAEERLDGKYLLSASDPDLSAEDVALGYKNLLEAERGFRDLKSTLELRPVFHRVEPRIRAHVLLCWLALLLIRVAERRTGLTWRRIELELSRLHAVTLTGSAGTVVQTTPLTDAQAAILPACQVTPPPRVTTLHPA
jgi:hypothetical protein